MELPPMLVISLRRSQERREHMARLLSNLGARWEFVDAVDGAALTDDEVRAVAGEAALQVQPALGRRLTRGEIGCALSHLACYRRLLDTDLPMAFVFEDDVTLLDSFLNAAAAIPRFPRGWEMVLLAHHSARRGLQAGAHTCVIGTLLPAGQSVARVAEFPMGAMASLVTREAARKLLGFAHPVRMPADWLTGYAPAAGVRLYAVSPPCVVPDAVTGSKTTLPDRDARVQPAPARDLVAQRVRGWAGSAWLQLRRAGIAPGAYAWRVPQPGPVRVSGFTIARRAVEFGYPLEASLRSLLPHVDELIVNVGDADDGTWEAVQAIGDPKITAFRSTWDLSKRDGLTLSEETNRALARCRGEWAIYLQADEVLHEAELPRLRAALERLRYSRVEALSLRYWHFYGSYGTYKDDPARWYRRATRIVRTGIGIRSVGDACAFQVHEGDVFRRPRRRDLDVHVYHYGRVRPPEQMLRKQRAFERLYYDDAWIARHGLAEDMDPSEIYADAHGLRVFTGTHPAVMRPLIAAARWPAPRHAATGWPARVRGAWLYGSWLAAEATSRLRTHLAGTR